MFSKAKRFEQKNCSKNHCTDTKKQANLKVITGHTLKSQKCSTEITPSNKKPLLPQVPKQNIDSHSQCSSKQSVRSLTTSNSTKLKKVALAKSQKSVGTKSISQKRNPEDIIKDQNVEIRNKNDTILEYNKYIEDLKNQIAQLHKQLSVETHQNSFGNLDMKFAQITLDDVNNEGIKVVKTVNLYDVMHSLQTKINELEQQIKSLEEEANYKQLEMSNLEEVITIRDSLCKDLQDKLTTVENELDETKQRLEMVKGHHALALEANESIRREYKAELEALRLKLDEDKQAIAKKSKEDQDQIKHEYDYIIASMKSEMLQERENVVQKLQEQIANKEKEMKAKLELIEEAAQEKVILCEIQFEERSKSIQEHLSQQHEEIKCLEEVIKELKKKCNNYEENNCKLQDEINKLMGDKQSLENDKKDLIKEIETMEKNSKVKYIEFENQVNKLMIDIDNAIKDKNKYKISLSVTRDIVQVLTTGLKESDTEIENLETKVQSLTSSKEFLENEMITCKTSLNSTIAECNEYKEALVNVLKSKAALAKEHTRIMEHNVSLIESLQNVEKEAYRELGTIKNELIEDVELLKKESNTQIHILREEVEEKQMLYELATEHAGQATAASEQARLLLGQASNEINRLEEENQRLQKQIQDQQSIVVELSLLRQENEELTMTVAKQPSVIDKLKKDVEQSLLTPKSPSMVRKSSKLGKENNIPHNVISPLRERNH